MNSLAIHIDDRLIGTVVEEGNLWRLEYAPTWQRDAECFALSPALPVDQSPIVDGASQRPVQWFFDNLLPEEALRESIAREARLARADDFGLLAWLGAESVGALTLCEAGRRPVSGGLAPLSAAALSQRIQRLPRESLQQRAPKRMSLAGAQHKLPVVVEAGVCLEPIGNTASTHIIKPDHPDRDTYPWSATNEWFCMTLSARLGLEVPPVDLWRVPESVFVVRRFDREGSGKHATRRHALDGCQLLGIDRRLKYHQMSVLTLRRLSEATRTRALTRQRLFQWLVFNVLIGNNDAHLKNVSFLVNGNDIALAPHYDLLCTAIYPMHEAQPPALANVELSLPIADATHYGDVTFEHLIQAGESLGMAASACQRILETLTRATIGHAITLAEACESSDANPGELRLTRQIVHGVIKPMVSQLSRD